MRDSRQLLPIHFIVSGAVKGVSGVYHVIGRCGDSPIRVGDIFEQIEHSLEPSKPVHLTVDRIQAYERSFEELGPGMTGTLDVHGDGTELLRPNSVLIASGSAMNTESDSVASQPTSHV